MENHTNNSRLKLAKARMEEVKAFNTMLGGFVILMPYLIFVNLKSTPDFHWFWFPIAGCGISIFGYAIYLFGYAIYLFGGKSWEQKKIREIMNNQKSI